MNTDDQKRFSGTYWARLSGAAWRQLADRLKRQADYCCQWCGTEGRERTNDPKSPSLHVHHKNYQRLASEKESDLIVVCSACHPYLDKNRDQLIDWKRRIVLDPIEEPERLMTIRCRCPHCGGVGIGTGLPTYEPRGNRYALTCRDCARQFWTIDRGIGSHVLAWLGGGDAEVSRQREAGE